MKALIIVSLVVLALGIGAFFLLTPKAPTPAILYVESGAVEVDTGNGWSVATNEMALHQGDQIRTLEGKATVVILEGEFVSLSLNSHIVLETIGSKNVKVTQLAGETWNKISKLSGIIEFSTGTPTTVATVRGTEYIMTMMQLFVDEGLVDFEDINTSQSAQVGAEQKISIDEFVAQQFTDEDRARFAEHHEEYVDVLRQLRWREILKHTALLTLAETKGITQEQIKVGLLEVDEGKRNEDELYAQVPSVFKSRAQRTYELTKLIKAALNEA